MTGGHVTRLAYSDEVSDAVRAVYARKGNRLPLAPTPHDEAELWTLVMEELHTRSLGMPPHQNRASLAAAVRQLIDPAYNNPIVAAGEAADA